MGRQGKREITGVLHFEPLGTCCCKLLTAVFEFFDVTGLAFVLDQCCALC